jgi:two-component system, OmpR family, phosphate regulon sensor histidine kinase PhoR
MINNESDSRIKQLTEYNDELENYFRNTIIPQLFIDADFRLRKFTPPAMKQFNLTYQDTGRSIDEIKDNFRFPSIIENISWVIENKTILEKEIQTTDMRWYQMNILPYITEKTKESNGVIMTFVEITARIKDLKDLEKLISDHETLLDSISHDIKNPLTSMRLTLELIKQETAGSSQFKALFKNLENSLHTLQDIIHELTDTRKKEHKYESEVELLSFENIVEDVRLSLTDLINETRAKITTDIAASQIVFSRRKLRSIVYNLVNNALKYRASDRAPKILIRSWKENGFFVITISDNGRGIPSENIKEIFSKYYRIANDIDGSGVGLYLVKESLIHSGGSIDVESEPGKGTTFKVRIKIG